MSRKKGPGKSDRIGISVMELTDLFPDEEVAPKWFEEIYWPTCRCCRHCSSQRTRETKYKTMSYWCRHCRSIFFVWTGTELECSRLPLRKWAFAVCLYVTDLKSVPYTTLHRDIQVTQKTA